MFYIAHFRPTSSGWGTLVGVAFHLVEEGCSVLMTREFGEAGDTRMAAATMCPTINGQIALAKAVAATASSSATSTLVAEDYPTTSWLKRGVCRMESRGGILLGCDLGLEEVHCRTIPLKYFKETTSQILYTLWNSRTRNSNFRPLIQRLYMCR
jgi:hypothetical protein